MKSKRGITPTSQLSRDEARKLLEECVHGFLEDGDEAKAQVLLKKAQLCLADAKSIEGKARTKGLN